MMILILGGSGSGKSAYAEDYLLRTAGDKKKYYIATMQIWDEEMQAKVDRHHRLRQGKGFTTIEQPTALEQAASQMAVSYTHLDVYKRQSWNWRRRSPIESCV